MKQAGAIRNQVEMKRLIKFVNNHFCDVLMYDDVNMTMRVFNPADDVNIYPPVWIEANIESVRAWLGY